MWAYHTTSSCSGVTCLELYTVRHHRPAATLVYFATVDYKKRLFDRARKIYLPGAEDDSSKLLVHHVGNAQLGELDVDLNNRDMLTVITAHQITGPCIDPPSILVLLNRNALDIALSAYNTVRDSGVVEQYVWVSHLLHDVSVELPHIIIL